MVRTLVIKDLNGGGLRFQQLSQALDLGDQHLAVGGARMHLYR